MKRITFFLSLLLMFFAGVGSTWAETTQTPLLSADGTYHYYAIKNTRTGKYLYWNNNGDYLRQSTWLNGNGFFYFTAGSTTATTDGVTSVKIHNKETTTMMADFKPHRITIRMALHFLITRLLATIVVGIATIAKAKLALGALMVVRYFYLRK